ncbi:hypothetical protein AB205_0041980, partial [Aquarana catesbeiana]
MARGQQKIQSQQKNAKKQAEKKKHGSDQKAAAKAALVFTCPVCRFNSLDEMVINHLTIVSSILYEYLSNIIVNFVITGSLCGQLAHNLGFLSTLADLPFSEGRTRAFCWQQEFKRSQ